MNIGLKLYSHNIGDISPFFGHFDFFEVLIEPGFKPAPLSSINGPIKIHTAHSSFGFNLSDRTKKKLNESILSDAINAADYSKSDTIVVHVEGSSETFFEDVTSFLEKNYDKRIVLENTARTHRDGMINSLYTASDFGKLLSSVRVGFALDFSHAISAANQTGMDPLVLIDDFLKLKPRYFHAGGQNINDKYDSHAHFYDTPSDYSYLKKMPRDTSCAIETATPSLKSFDKIILDKKFLIENGPK